MKKKLQFVFAAAMLFGGSVLAQHGSRPLVPVSPGALPALTSSNAKMSTATCGPDVIDYVFQKIDTLYTTNNTNPQYLLDVWPGETYSTAYFLNQPATVNGVIFLGAVSPTSTAPTTVEVGVWNVDASLVPTTMITSTTVTITSTTLAVYQPVFPTAAAVTGNFAVTLKNTQPNTAGADTVQTIMTNYNQTFYEGLSAFDYGGGNWDTWANNWSASDLLEVRIIPIVTYSATADFTANNTTICPGGSVNFTNASSNIYGNKMFNLHAFDATYLGEVDSTYKWNFGDATPVVYSASPSHTFAAAGTYTVSMDARINGYGMNCVDTKTMTITVQPATAAAFTVDNTQEPMIAFTNTSTGATTYSWDFGDATTSTAANPTHTYAAVGTYNVVLTATGPCGTITSTQTVNITTTGVGQISGNVDVNAYFSADDNALHIALSSDATVSVYNMFGQVVYSQKLDASVKTIDMNGAAAGTYVVRVQTANGQGAAKFAVTK